MPAVVVDHADAVATTRRVRQWPVWLAIFAVVFVAHAASPNSAVADSLRTVAVAESMLDRRTISLDHYRTGGWGGPGGVPGYGVEEARGHLYPGYPWTTSIFLVPVVAVVDGAHALGLGPGVEQRAKAKDTDWEFQVVGMSLVVAATTVVVYAAASVALGHLDDRRRRWLALAAAFVFAFCTSMWSTASRAAWQHAPATFFLAISMLLALRSRDDPRAVRLMGAALAASYAMRPTSLIPFILFTLWVGVMHRRQLHWYALGAAVALLPFFVVNVRSWGSAIPPYWRANRVEFHPGMFEALAGNLVSPSRGLLVYSPVLVLSIAGVLLKAKQRSLGLLDVVMVLCVGAHWAAVSLAVDDAPTPHWWGGHSYGPRLFTEMLPLLVLLALPAAAWVVAARSRLLQAGCAALVAASFFLHWQGAFLRSSYCWNDLPREVDEHPSRLWDWQDPQFLRGISEAVTGPGWRSELVRGGVSAVGCPAGAEA